MTNREINEAIRLEIVKRLGSPNLDLTLRVGYALWLKDEMNSFEEAVDLLDLAALEYEIRLRKSKEEYDEYSD